MNARSTRMMEVNDDFMGVVMYVRAKSKEAAKTAIYMD